MSPRVQHRRRTDQARALAVVLGDEFGTPFVFHDCETGIVTESEREASGHAPQPLDATLMAELLRDGRARALRLPEGSFRLLLPIWDSCRPVLIAEALLPALAGTDHEQLRLQKWLQAVGDRLRLTEQMIGRRRGEQDQSSQVTTGWECSDARRPDSPDAHPARPRQESAPDSGGCPRPDERGSHRLGSLAAGRTGGDPGGVLSRPRRLPAAHRFARQGSELLEHRPLSL